MEPKKNDYFLDALINLFETKSTFPLNIGKDSIITQEIYKVRNHFSDF